MDVVNAISWIFLFMAAGPFLEKLFLTSASQNYSSATPQKEPAQEGSVLGPFSAGVDAAKSDLQSLTSFLFPAFARSKCQLPSAICCLSS
jgi:hypothetical protein